MSSDKPSFDVGIISDTTISSGQYSCPICHEFESDTVRSVQGHISGSRDEVHQDLGWNYEAEIRETATDS
ncbi:hypothetical protein [Halohasta salina]|uniref:hypothetical protein n=1 Tax=Halohasta salina TaxID=2961621 RepID=UPI0020A58362|nr:hypothetical protein [Halohasta salina]